MARRQEANKNKKLVNKFIDHLNKRKYHPESDSDSDDGIDHNFIYQAVPTPPPKKSKGEEAGEGGKGGDAQGKGVEKDKGGEGEKGEEAGEGGNGGKVQGCGVEKDKGGEGKKVVVE